VNPLPCCAGPEWQTAIATWAIFGATLALVVVTVGAVIVGGLAARSATETFRLEAEPLLVVKPRVNDETKLPTYLITGNPSLSEGLVLRGWTQSDDDQQRQWPSVILQFQNVGRSPALIVNLDVEVNVPMIVRPGNEVKGFEPDATQQSETGFDRTGVQHGGGIVSLPSVAPLASVEVRIQNRLGLIATVVLPEKGQQLKWYARTRATSNISVVSPQTSIKIVAAS
jgi:hypothetical protein